MSSPSPEALLEHVGFLRAVARGLLRDEADAEDVVQQTLAAAIEKPPADDSNLKGWLATVARNFARMQFRGSARRRARETAAARADDSPSTQDIAARLEMERLVVDAVSTLEEPFRTTVVLRYYDGLPPKEIAERFGIPAATVRTRLKRGLEKMRGELEEKRGGRRKMLAGLLLLAQLPAQAASPWPARLVAAGGAAAVIVAVVAVGWLVSDEWREPPPPERADAARARGPGADAAGPDKKRPKNSVSGRVVDARGLGVPLAEVALYPHDGPGRLETPLRRAARLLERPGAIARTRTDETGAYALSRPARPVWVVASKEGYALDAFPLLAAGAYEHADLRIRRTEGVRGRVLDGGMEPVAGAWVHGWDARFSWEFFPAIAATRTEEDGSFRLPFAPQSEPWMTVVVAAPGRMPRVQRAAGSRLEACVLREGFAGEVTLRGAGTLVLIGEDRLDVRHGEDAIRWADAPGPLSAVLYRPGAAPAYFEAGEETDAAPPAVRERAEVEIGVAGAEAGYRAPYAFREVAMFGVDTLQAWAADEDGRVTLTGEAAPIVVAHPGRSPVLAPGQWGPLPEAARIAGRVLDGEGQPVAGARVMAAPAEPNPLWGHYYRRQAGHWIAITGPDGAFSIGHLPAGELDAFKLVASHPGRGLGTESDHRATQLRMERVPRDRPRARSVPAAPPVDPGTAPSRARHRTGAGWFVDGRVYHRFTPVPDAWVGVEGLSTGGVRTDATGRFRVEVPYDRTYTVSVRKEGVGSGRFEGVGVDRLAELRIPSWEPFSGRVLYRGRPIEGAYVRSFVRGTLLEEGHTDASGRFSFECTPFDRAFSISVSHPGFLTAWIEKPVEGDFELERAARVRIRVVDGEGRVLPNVEVVVDGRRRRTDLDGHVDVFREAADGVSIDLAQTGQDWILAGPVEWSEDRSLATLRVREGLRIEGRVVDARNRPVPHVLVLAEPLEEGPPVRRAFTNRSGHFTLRTLYPGRYRVRTGGGEAIVTEAGRSVVLKKEEE